MYVIRVNHIAQQAVTRVRKNPRFYSKINKPRVLMSFLGFIGLMGFICRGVEGTLRPLTRHSQTGDNLGLGRKYCLSSLSEVSRSHRHTKGPAQLPVLT